MKFSLSSKVPVAYALVVFLGINDFQLAVLSGRWVKTRRSEALPNLLLKCGYQWLVRPNPSTVYPGAFISGDVDCKHTHGYIPVVVADNSCHLMSTPD